MALRSTYYNTEWNLSWWWWYGRVAMVLAPSTKLLYASCCQYRDEWPFVVYHLSMQLPTQVNSATYPLQEEKCVLAKRHCFDWQGNRKSGNRDSVIYPIIDSMWCKAPFTCLNFSFALAILAYTIHVLWMHLYNECRIKFKPFWTPNWNYNSCHLGWC